MNRSSSRSRRLAVVAAASIALSGGGGAAAGPFDMFDPGRAAEMRRGRNATLVDDSGRVRLRVAAHGGSALVSRRPLSLDPAHPSLWYAVGGAVYATTADGDDGDTPVVRLPPHGSDRVTAVAAGRKRLYVARGRYVYAFERPGDTYRRSAKLDENVYSLAVTGDGMVLAMCAGWYFRRGVLVALHGGSLTERWRCDGVYAYPVVLRDGGVVCLRESDETHAYVAVALDDGAVERRAAAIGAPAGWMRPVGERLVTIVQDDSARVGRSTNNLYLERFDPGTGERTATSLKRKKHGLGDITSSLAVLGGDTDAALSAIAVSGRRRSVVLCGGRRLVSVPVREEQHLEKHGRLAVVGRCVALAVRNRVHLLDIDTRRHVSTLHGADRIEQLGVCGGNLLVRGRNTFYRLEPVEQGDHGVSVSMLRAQPWELGDGNALTDNDRRSAYAFPGDGRLDILFPAPRVVSSVRLAYGRTCGEAGRVRRIDVYATNEPFARLKKPLLRFEPSSPHGAVQRVLSGDAVIARQLTLILQCRRCDDTAARDPLCEITELLIE